MSMYAPGPWFAETQDEDVDVKTGGDEAKTGRKEKVDPTKKPGTTWKKRS